MSGKKSGKKKAPSTKVPCDQCGMEVHTRGMASHKLNYHSGREPKRPQHKTRRKYRRLKKGGTVAPKEPALVTEITQITETPPAQAPVVPFNLPDLSGQSQKNITAQIEALLDRNGLDRSLYSTEELAMLRLYEGHGGLAKKQLAKGDKPELGIFDQFYTPYDTIAKMWGLVLLHGYNPSQPNRILEPAAGIGRVLEYVPNTPDQIVDAYETSKYAWMICRLTMPGHFNFVHASFETLFFENTLHLGLSAVQKKYNLVIGNPPYRAYKSELSLVKGLNGKSETEETLARTFDQYFLMRGVDVLVPGGLLTYVMPNTFMSNGDSYNGFKELLFSKANLVDAYRLPDVFEHTSIGTDLLVLKKKG